MDGFALNEIEEKTTFGWRLWGFFNLKQNSINAK
jgi:hypothetical protein